LRYDDVKQWRTSMANGREFGKNFASFEYKNVSAKNLRFDDVQQ